MEKDVSQLLARLTKLFVGLAEIFDDEPDHAVPDQVKRQHGPGSSNFPFQGPKYGKQKNALAECFVKLGGVSQLQARGRKIHAPWDSGDAAPKFAVDEVAQPAESICDGNAGNQQIDRIFEGQLVFAAIPQSSHDNADQPDMPEIPEK